MSSKTTPSTTNAKAPTQPLDDDDDGRTAHVRLVSSTRREKTAKEAEKSLDAKLAKARAGQPVPETPEPTPENPAPWTQAEGEPSGLAPVTTIRPKPVISPKASSKTKNKEKEKSEVKPSAAKPKSQETTKAKTEAKSAAKATSKTQAKSKSKTPSPAKTSTTATTGKTTAAKSDAKTNTKGAGKSSSTTSAKATAKTTTKTASQPKAKPASSSKSSESPAKANTSSADDAPVTASPTPGLLASLIGFAPAGVDVEAVPDDRPHAGEVKGSPESEPQGTLARLMAAAAREDTQADIPSDDEAEPVSSDNPSSSVKTSSSPAVMILNPAPETDAPRKARVATPVPAPSLDDAPYHATVELTGRRSAPKRKSEPIEPERETIDLETEALADDAVAEMTLLKRRAARQPQRDELEARMMRAGVEAAGLTPATSNADNPQAQKPDVESALWANDARRANSEHQARIDTPTTPVYDFASDDPTVPMEATLANGQAIDARITAAADYAERITEWENRVLDDANRRDRLSSPHRRNAPAERIPVVTASNETLGGFPAARDVRPWVNVSGTDLPPPPPTLAERWLRMLSKVDRLCLEWQGLHAALKTSLVVMGTALVAATAAGLTAHAMVPGLTERHTPVSVTAVVADNEIRDLMMLVSLLEARQVSIGRTAPTVSLTHLPHEMRASLEHDTPADRMALPLDDRLLKAALRETADWVGAPILSKSVVLAMPDIAHAPIGRTLDVTEEVVKRLGLAGVSAAAAKEALNVVLSPKHEPNVMPFAFDRLTTKTPAAPSDKASDSTAFHLSSEETRR